MKLKSETGSNLSEKANEVDKLSDSDKEEFKDVCDSMFESENLDEDYMPYLNPLTRTNDSDSKLH